GRRLLHQQPPVAGVGNAAPTCIRRLPETALQVMVMSVSEVQPLACDLLIEAGYVVPVEPHAVVLEDHAVAVTDGVIVGILPRAEARRRFNAEAGVSRPEAALIPGLVNAH